MGYQNIRVSTQWEHSITNLLGHAPTTEPGIALRQRVHNQGVENHLDLLSWEEEEVKANLPNRYSPWMIMDRVHTLGPTRLNKYVGL